jgi:hypothetical protein
MHATVIVRRTVAGLAMSAALVAAASVFAVSTSSSAHADEKPRGERAYVANVRASQTIQPTSDATLVALGQYVCEAQAENATYSNLQKPAQVRNVIVAAERAAHPRPPSDMSGAQITAAYERAADALIAGAGTELCPAKPARR